jgi:hypothetical protein
MQLTKIQHDGVMAALKLLRNSLQGGLVSPNKGEIGGILTNGGEHGGLTLLDIDLLRAELVDEPGLVMPESVISVDLNICDDEGNVVDGATADLTLPQISDIVDHASQLILVRRSGKAFLAILDELDDALVVAGVIEEGD